MTIDRTNIHRRLKVFNGQLFDNIFEQHSKDTLEMHKRFMRINFERLFIKAAKDPNVTMDELELFEYEYQVNLFRLSEKDLTKKSDNTIYEKFEEEFDKL